MDTLCRGIMTHTVKAARTSALSSMEMCWSLLVEKVQVCIRDLRKKSILSDLSAIAIPHADIGDQTLDAAVESQCSAT